jgi:hypothetical protein
MSGHDRVTPSAGLTAESPQTRDRPSRRSVLRGAAGAGAASLAAAAMGGVAAPALAATPPDRPVSPSRAGAAGSRALAAAGSAGSRALAAGPDAPRALAAGTAAHEVAAEPVVVHVRDARSGEMDVFAGTRHVRLRDQDLAARLARAVR